MRTRRNSVGLWLSDAELTHLRQQCQITGLNTNTYLRKLIMGEHLCPRPPDAYAALLRELSAIGNTSTRSRTGQTEKAMRRKQKSTKRPAL